MSECKWSTVRGYPGYSVSTDGKVMSYKRKAEGAEIAQSLDFYDNPSVKLYVDKKAKHMTVARLVADAFIDNPRCLTKLIHIDQNPLNNDVTNLAWADATLFDVWNDIDFRICNNRFIIVCPQMGKALTSVKIAAMYTGRTKSEIMHSIKTGETVKGLNFRVCGQMSSFDLFRLRFGLVRRVCEV